MYPDPSKLCSFLENLKDLWNIWMQTRPDALTVDTLLTSQRRLVRLMHRNHQVKVRKTSLAFKIPVSVSTNEVPSNIQPGFTLTHVETWPWTLDFCSATFSLRPNIKSQVMNMKYEHDMKLFCQYGITANILSQHLLWTFTTSLLTKPISGLSPKTKSPNSRSNRKPSTRVLAERT